MTIQDEVGRAEAKVRTATATAFGKVLKKTAMGTGWRFASGTLFRAEGDWFLEVTAAVWVGRRRTAADFHFKPLAIDPLFWTIVEAEENNSQPLSFRAHGAWTCRSPVFAQTEIEEGPGRSLEQMAGDVLTWADQCRTDIASYDSDKYIEFIRQGPTSHQGGHLATLITALILYGRTADAALLIRDALERGERGGYSVGSRSFMAMAADRLGL